MILSLVPKTRVLQCLLCLVLMLGITAPNIAQASAIRGNFAPLENIDATTLDTLSRTYAGQRFDSFRDFVMELYFYRKTLFSYEQHLAMAEFVVDGALTADERELLFRLLGLYTQLKYGGEAIRSLAELVAIPTFKIEGVENHKNANFRRFEKKLRKLARKFKLQYRNVDNRVYEITMAGGSDTVIALHAHADVVPAKQNDWLLADGTQLDPFTMTRIDGRLYGRGTQDDKNAIVVVMYALRVMKEEKIKLWNDIKLLIDTTEETSSTAIPYYLKRNPTPQYNISLDGDYPVLAAGVSKSNWLNALVRIANENLDLPPEFDSRASETLVHSLPNGIQFGLAMPNEKYTGHKANEFKTVDQFLLDMQVVTEVIIRLGQMNQME